MGGGGKFRPALKLATRKSVPKKSAVEACLVNVLDGFVQAEWREYDD